MSIAANLEKIASALPKRTKLVAVSKFHPAEAVGEAYRAGQRIFGESRVQELDPKRKELPDDIEWHFIGHLQSNKIKTLVPYIHTIHSVDSWKLLSEIDKQATASGRKINCLLEIYIAEEETKYGLSFDECRALLSENDWQALRTVQITGLMGMATLTNDAEQIRREFRSLKNFFDELKNGCFRGNSYFSELSMGMSHDYRIAVEEGSTMVRIGSSIFGERKY
ncbi:MAG: YggS family pyridoxal phosphate-dependent enzyme [Prevotella sp.]|jgi:pyridoxal phosphate enzyme (YggS family)|nr:YggS family pyridoxal phosphate-dependent enzyme [Prevotella sp.]